MASSSSVIEHPVFFDMPGLSDDPQLEVDILRGLANLKHSEHSDLYFLHVGKPLSLLFWYGNVACRLSKGSDL